MQALLQQGGSQVQAITEQSQKALEEWMRRFKQSEDQRLALEAQLQDRKLQAENLTRNR